VGGTACAVELRQACNGALAALELGSAYLAAAPASASALLTTSDRCPPGTDRYRSGQGELAGAGAAGAVLSPGGGGARLLCTAIVGDGRFLGTGSAVDPGQYASRAEFLVAQRRRLRPMLRAMSALQQQSVQAALADAGLDSAEIDRWVFANVGQFLVDQEFRKMFGIDESITTWDWGRTIGHLGAGNQFAGFTHLVEDGLVRVGDRVALCGNGVGFSYGCAVLEIVSKPGWAGSGREG